MKILSAVTTDPLPLTEVLTGESPRIFPAGTEVSAISAGSGWYHINAKSHGFTFAGNCSLAQLEIRGVLALVNEGGK